MAASAWSTAEAVGAHLAAVSPTLLAAGLALHTLRLLTRARAWQNVLRTSLPERQVRFRDAAIPYLAGIGAGALVPFGGSELVRVGLASGRLRSGGKACGITGTILGSLAVERALDVVVSAVVIVVALGGGLLPTGVLHARLAGLAALLAHPVVAELVGGAIALSAVALWRNRRRLALAGRAVLPGVLVLKQPKCYLASVASWQLLSWALRFTALVLFLEAFHVPSAALVAPVVLSLQLLAGSVPATPAGVGTQQALVAATLGGGVFVGFSAGAQVATMLFDLLLGATALACCGIRPGLQALRSAAAPA